MRRRVPCIARCAAWGPAAVTCAAAALCGLRGLGAPASAAGRAAVGMPPPARGRVAAAALPADSGGEESFITTAEVAAAAKRLNVELREEVTGPWYQMALYSGDRQLGKTSGWAQPWGVLHLETIEVRRFTGYWVSKPKGPDSAAESAEDEKRYADVAKIARWLGLLLSVSIGCWNRERSPFYCHEAQLLAIKDEEKQHEQLVRYYRSLGFKTLRESDQLNFQDQILWGGEGTLMNVEAESFMRRWTPIVRQLGSRAPPREEP